MVRNLLYSICLHLIFLVFILVNGKMSGAKFSNNLNIIEMDKNFNFANIKTTKDDTFSNLSLGEKIKLYVYNAKNNNNQKVNNEPSISSDKIKQLNKIAPKKFNKKKDILYLGPTAYARLKRQNENLKTQKNITKEELIDNIIANEGKTTVVANVENVDMPEIVDKKNGQKNDLKVDINTIFTDTDLEIIKKVIEDSDSINLLSNREKKMLQQQLKSCWRMATIKNNKISKVAIFVEAEISRSGFVNMNKIKMKVLDKENKFTKKDYNEAIENAKSALIFCSPLRNLPIIKYESWQKINFIFNIDTND